MNRKLNNRGLSLVEILVSMLILAMLMGVVYTGFSAGYMSWQTYQSNIITQQQVRKVFETLKRDLREASNISITQDGTNTNLSFSKTSGDSIDYTWTNTGDDANQVIREVNGSGTPIANSISAFTLTDNTTSVTVTISATKSSATGQDGAFSLKEKIALRS